MSINAYSDTSYLKGEPNGYQLNARLYNLYVDGSIIGGIPAPTPAQIQPLIELSNIDTTTGKVDVHGLTKDIVNGTILQVDSLTHHLNYDDPLGNRILVSNNIVGGTDVLLNDKLLVEVFNNNAVVGTSSMIISGLPIQNTPGISNTHLEFTNEQAAIQTVDKNTPADFGLITIRNNLVEQEINNISGNSFTSLQPNHYQANLNDIGNGACSLSMDNATVIPKIILEAGTYPASNSSEVIIQSNELKLVNHYNGNDYALLAQNGDFYLTGLPNDPGATSYVSINPPNGLLKYHTPPPSVNNIALVGVGAHQFVSGGSGLLNFRAMSSPGGSIAFTATPTEIQMDTNIPGIQGGMFSSLRANVNPVSNPDPFTNGLIIPMGTGQFDLPLTVAPIGLGIADPYIYDPEGDFTVGVDSITINTTGYYSISADIVILGSVDKINPCMFQILLQGQSIFTAPPACFDVSQASSDIVTMIPYNKGWSLSGTANATLQAGQILTCRMLLNNPTDDNVIEIVSAVSIARIDNKFMSLVGPAGPPGPPGPPTANVGMSVRLTGLINPQNAPFYIIYDQVAGQGCYVSGVGYGGLSGVITILTTGTYIFQAQVFVADLATCTFGLYGITLGGFYRAAEIENPNAIKVHSIGSTLRLTAGEQIAVYCNSGSVGSAAGNSQLDTYFSLQLLAL